MRWIWRKAAILLWSAWNHMTERYFTELANAFVRGKLRHADATVEDGINAGLRRVQRILGILRGLAPENLLDIGSGRGTFLWPLLATFPELRVTAVDFSERRSSDLAAVQRGGIERLNVVRMDAERPAFARGAFDVITMLEVLEQDGRPSSTF